MKTTYSQLAKPMFAIILSVLLYSCSATVKIPKHPGPGEPLPPPQVEINKN